MQAGLRFTGAQPEKQAGGGGLISSKIFRPAEGFGHLLPVQLTGAAERGQAAAKRRIGGGFGEGVGNREGNRQPPALAFCACKALNRLPQRIQIAAIVGANGEHDFAAARRNAEGAVAGLYADNRTQHHTRISFGRCQAIQRR